MLVYGVGRRRFEKIGEWEGRVLERTNGARSNYYEDVTRRNILFFPISAKNFFFHLPGGYLLVYTLLGAIVDVHPPLATICTPSM